MERYLTVFVATLVVTACAASGCTMDGPLGGSDAAIPAVTHVEGVGGTVMLAEVDGRQLIVTTGGVVARSGSGYEREFPVPSGFSLLTHSLNDQRVLLLGGEGARNTLGVWDLSRPEDPPVLIEVGDGIVGLMAVDLLGDKTPELVMVVDRPWHSAAYATSLSYERVEVWSLEGEAPERLYRGELVAEGRMSLIGDVRAVDTGIGDGRPELLWRQLDATNNTDGDGSLVVVAPTEGFTVYESERFERGQYVISGVQQEADGARILLSHTLDSSAQAVVADVRRGEFHLSSQEIDALDFSAGTHTEMGGGYGPRLPEELRSGFDVSAVRNEYGSPLEVTFTDGGTLLLEPSAPITRIVDVGLADIDGDGREELVVLADGEPGICNDTMNGFVGWAKREADGTFGEIEWSEPLGGGLDGVVVADIDGQPGMEIVIGVCDSYCSGVPAGLWVFSPGADRR